MSIKANVTFDDAAESILRQLQERSGRNLHGVLSDALAFYGWALEQVDAGRTITTSDDPRELAYRMVLEMRGVDDPCPACSGFGVRVYGSTATWRGGIGGQAMTTDVCDRCWGTGDRARKGADLRALTSQRQAWEAEQCAQWLARRVGVGLTSTRAHLRLLIGVLEREARKRKPAGVEEREVFWYRQSIDALAGVLHELIAEAEATHPERPET